MYVNNINNLHSNSKKSIPVEDGVGASSLDVVGIIKMDNIKRIAKQIFLVSIIMSLILRWM